MTPGAAEAADPPVVNGLFYGDGDDQDYVLYATSEYGSGLYVYFDNPTLYVALVNDRSVNDNVFDYDRTPYSESAGWKSRSAKRLSDSEFASFELGCEATPLSWTWAQGYARLDGGIWVSDEFGAGFGTPPLSYESASSFAWNINTYNTNPLWPRGTDIADWKSPFDSLHPDTVINELEGYPETGPITFSNAYQYEWPMVYEWSVNLATAGCGDDPIYLLTGLSHHSPMKNGDEDENDEFLDPPLGAFYDFGDLPDTYSTRLASSGAAHLITINGAHLGTPPDLELDGQDTPFATGDGTAGISDEDGVFRSEGLWTNTAIVNVHFDLQGASTTADIAMWIDWNGDGVFGADEYYVFLDRPTGTLVSESIVVPTGDIYTVGDSLHARIRVFDDEADAPGGSLDSGDFAGIAESGEVEDYFWEFDPSAVGLQSFSGRVDQAPSALVWLGLIGMLVLTGFGLYVVRRLRYRTIPIRR